jgi:nucleotide-binding universal stress UspA family protein
MGAGRSGAPGRDRPRRPRLDRADPSGRDAGFAPGALQSAGGDEEYERIGRRVLDETVDASVESAGPEVSVHRVLVHDAPTQALIAAALDAELLVVGSRGLGGFKELLLGSVSHECANHAPCPVVIVRGR